jgi:hypothetical protein
LRVIYRDPSRIVSAVKGTNVWFSNGHALLSLCNLAMLWYVVVMNNSLSKRVAMSVLAATVGTAHAQLCRQELLVNGSFESPVIANNTAQQIAPTGWTWETDFWFVFRGSPAPIWPVAHTGEQYADIGNFFVYRLKQGFTLTHPSRVWVTWYDNVAAGFSTSYDVAIFREPEDVIVYYYDFGFSSGGGWQQDSISGGTPVVLPAGSYSLVFLADSLSGNGDTLIDTVSIEVDRGPDANRPEQTFVVSGGDRFTLDARVTGQSPMQRQWQVETAPGMFANLTENQSTPVGVVQGVQTDVLVIDRAINGATAKFRLLLNNVCRGAVSPVWTLNVSRCNTIDINLNGVFPEDQDVIDFFNVLAGGACSTGDCVGIDFNGNGVFPEDQDVIDYFAVLAGASCPT